MGVVRVLLEVSLIKKTFDEKFPENSLFFAESVNWNLLELF